MAEQILVMPKFGLTMTEGTVSEWLVQPGQSFEAGQALVAIETDKAVTELEAPAAGVMLGHLAEVGTTLDVGEPIARWQPPVAAAGGGTEDAGAPRPLISLAAASYARERGIDLAQVSGSGPRGRVERADVEAYARAQGLDT